MISLVPHFKTFTLDNFNCLQIAKNSFLQRNHIYLPLLVYQHSLTDESHFANTSSSDFTLPVR